MIRDIAYYHDRLAAWPEPADRRTALIAVIQSSIAYAGGRDDALAAEVRAAITAYEELAAADARARL